MEEKNHNIVHLGQVFTPKSVVDTMVKFCKNDGRVLEPSCGDGAFLEALEGKDIIALELDRGYCHGSIVCMDFFDYSLNEQFDTIIGNPPYVRYQDILASTKEKLDKRLFDERSNLYLFFIEKAIRHLKPGGELIFITPRDFLKATAARKLNKFIYDEGTITDIIDLGDQRVFDGASPNCVIFRFERGNFTRKTTDKRQFLYSNGQLFFTKQTYPVRFGDVFKVKVGAVSGMDKVFANEEHGNADFVCSYTRKTGETKRMIYNTLIPYLDQYKQDLINRKIRKFDESNWWKWGRNHHKTIDKRVYVNCKTRQEAPFFVHECNDYDGAVLALFPYDQDCNLEELCTLLNGVDWGELGYLCDGRYIFSQKSLENCPLPDVFKPFERKKNNILL